jgi:hypothetical protein
LKMMRGRFTIASGRIKNTQDKKYDYLTDKQSDGDSCYSEEVFHAFSVFGCGRFSDSLIAAIF